MAHYTTGTWSGLPNFSCTHCAFETLDEAEMLTHIIDRHLPGAKPEKEPEPEPEQQLPVLVATSEQLADLLKPRKKARKEK